MDLEVNRVGEIPWSKSWSLGMWVILSLSYMHRALMTQKVFSVTPLVCISLALGLLVNFGLPSHISYLK